MPSVPAFIRVRCQRPRLLAASILLAAAPAVAGLQPFTQEAAERGLVYQMLDYPQAYGYLGLGCGFADLDVDGDPDVIVIGAADGHVGIFENDGTGHFIDRSATSGIPALASGSAFAAADYDADGDLDIYFTQVGENDGGEVTLYPNVLVRNDGSFQFTDVSDAAGVADLGASKGPCWGDFDDDGWVDLYVPNYNGIVPGTGDMDNRLYRNLGDGTFQDVAVEQTVDDFGYGFQAVWFDFDKDGDVDLYLSNDRGHLPPLFRGNQLWRNDDGQLVNISKGSGADLGLFSMGVACGDFDGNRWPDIYVTNIGNYADGFNPLFLNQGSGASPQFVESSALWGVDQYITSWGAVFFDFDNEGKMELYVNNQFLENTFYKHDPDNGFPCLELAASLDIAGPTNPFPYQLATGVSFCAAVADVDADGDLDVLENDLGENVRLYINNEGSANGNNWIRYRIVGDGANTFAVGASVDTRVGLQWHWREVLAGGNGYLGQNELIRHVGLAGATQADEIVVRWPSDGPMRTLTGLPANQTWTLYPPARLGDADGNGTVDAEDLQVIAGCAGMPVQPGCEMMDFDGDSDIDGADAEAFMALYEGPTTDCDTDGTADQLQILQDPGLDAGGNGLLDACESAGDVNGDGEVDVQDITTLIVNWGPCGIPCFGDTNGDGEVDVADLVAVVLGWS